MPAEPSAFPLFPVEILDLALMRNASILIKGKAGTGKTSFAIEIASFFNNIIFVTGNNFPETMQERYPWLQSRSFNVINVAKWFEGDGIVNTMLAERVRELGAQISNMEIQQSDSILIFDDLESFMLGLPSADVRVQNKQFLDFVKSVFAGTWIIISDSAGDTGIEAKVDCVLVLHDDILDKAPIRKLEIEKIGQKRRYRRYIPFTLKDGRFACGSPLGQLAITNAESWVVSSDPIGSQSTGSEQIDALYKDVLKMASFNLFELDPNMPASISSFFLSAVINFLQQGHGVIVSTIESIDRKSVV